MATLTEIAEHFLAPMQDLLGEPKRHNPQGFYETVNEVLEPYTVHQLQCAAKLFRRSWQHGYWPMPQKMADTCEKFPAEPRPDSPKSYRPKQEPNYLTTEQVYAQLHGPMAVEAAQNGWALSLFEYVREHGLLPPPAEEERIKAEASRVWQFQDMVLAGEVPNRDGELKPLADRRWQGMAQAMRDKQDRIARKILSQNTTQEAS